jgi:hypothetical protein
MHSAEHNITDHLPGRVDNEFNSMSLPGVDLLRETLFLWSKRTATILDITFYPETSSRVPYFRIAGLQLQDPASRLRTDNRSYHNLNVLTERARHHGSVWLVNAEYSLDGFIKERPKRVSVTFYAYDHLSEIVVSDNGHRVFITEDEYPTRGVCFSFTRFDIRTFTCFIRVSLVLDSVYILDRASIGMHGFCLDPRLSVLSFPAHVAAPYFNTTSRRRQSYRL